jgi:hypothetical protein
MMPQSFMDYFQGTITLVTFERAIAQDTEVP